MPDHVVGALPQPGTHLRIPLERNRARTDARAARRSPSSPRTRRCASTCRSDSPGRSPGRTASRWRRRRCVSSVADMVAVRIGVGRSRGVRSGSRIGSRSTSPMMTRCGFRTRRSTRRSTSKAEALSDASSSPVYEPDARYAYRALARRRGQEVRHGPRLTIVPSPATGRARSWGSRARRSERSSSAPPASRCSCSCPGCRAMATSRARRTGPR